MTKQFVLNCDTQRLWPHDTGSRLYFGLNLWTAFAFTESLSQSDLVELAPWRWYPNNQPITEMYVWARPGTTAQNLYQLPVLTSTAIDDLRDDTSSLSSLRTNLTTRVNELFAGGIGIDAFLWDPLHPLATQDDESRLYRNLLAYLSTTPYPIPHALNLSHCFYADVTTLTDFAADSADDVIVAPAVHIAGTLYTPVAAGPTQVGASNIYQWEYEPPLGGAGEKLYAYVTPCLSDPPDAAVIQDRFFDITNYWVRPNPNGVPTPTTFGEDWATLIESRIADAWDLPKLMLDAVTAKVGDGVFVPEISHLREAVYASIRDRSGMATVDTPDDAGILRYVVRRAVARWAEVRLPSGNTDTWLSRPDRLEAFSNAWLRSVRIQCRQFENHLHLHESGYFTDEIHLLEIDGSVSGGTFTLRLGGQATSSAAIPHNANASTIETALEGLGYIGNGNVSVVPWRGKWRIRFIGALAKQPIGTLIGDGTNLTGASGSPLSIERVAPKRIAAWMEYLWRAARLEESIPSDSDFSSILNGDTPGHEDGFHFEFSEPDPANAPYRYTVQRSTQSNQAGFADTNIVLDSNTWITPTIRVDKNWVDWTSVNGAWDMLRQLRVQATSDRGNWYRVRVTDATGTTYDSKIRRVEQSPLSMIRKIYNALESDDAVRDLIRQQWNDANELPTLADNSRIFLQPLALAPNTASEKYFRQFYWGTGGGPGLEVGRETGELSLNNRAWWFITFGNIYFGDGSVWDGESYTISISDESASQDVTLLVRQWFTGGNYKLRFTLSNGTAAEDVNWDSAPLTWSGGSTPAPYHLRLQLQYDATIDSLSPNAEKFHVRVLVATFEDGGDNPTWTATHTATNSHNFDFKEVMSGSHVAVAASNSNTAEYHSEHPSAIEARATLDDVVNETRDVAELLARWDIARIENTTPKARFLNACRAFWEQFGDTVENELLPDLDVNKQLALGNISRIHNKIVRYVTPNTAQTLVTNFADNIEDAFPHRLGVAGNTEPNQDSFYRDYRPHLREAFPYDTTSTTDYPRLKPVIEDYIQRFAPRYAWRRLVRIKTTTSTQERPQTTQQPHGLSVQIDHIDRFEGRERIGAETKNDIDELRQVSGIGVLCRQADASGSGAPTFTGRWRSLTLSEVHHNALTGANLEATAVTPVRIPYRDGTRQSFVIYNNHPMAARSPAHKYLELHSIEGYELVDGVDSERLLAYDHVKLPLTLDPDTAAGGDPANAEKLRWAFLPSLKFGQYYQVQPHLIGNCGALPVELADTTAHPAELIDNGTFPRNDTNFVRQIRYLRRTGVGSPRFSSLSPGDRQGRGIEEFAFPSVPPDVLPLARELELRAVSELVPVERFFFNRMHGVGELDLTVNNWSVVVRHVIETGVSTDATQNFQVTLSVGNGQAANTISIAIQRAGNMLTAELLSPTTASTNPLSGAITYAADPIDLRVDVDGNSVALSWRNSYLQTAPNAWDNAVDVAGTPTDVRWMLTNVFPPTSDAFVTVNASASAKTLAYSTPHVRTNRLGEVPIPVPEVPLLLCTRPDELEPFPNVRFRPKPQYAFNPPNGSHTTPYFEFGVRPPATDIETWSRWVEMDHWLGVRHLASSEQLQVVSQYQQHLPDQAKEEFDLTIDDPAVGLLSPGQRTGKFLVELVPLLVETAGATSEQRLVDVPTDNLTSNGLPHVRSKPVTCVVEIASAAGGSRLSVSGSEVTVQILEQEIWELRVYALVADSFLDDSDNAPGSLRFESWMGLDAADGGYPQWTDSNTGRVWRLLSPRRLILEGTFAKTLILGGGNQSNPALNLKYNQQTLFDSTLAARQNSDNVVAVDLSKVSPRKFRYVATVELARQVWRWRGRPLPNFPFEQAKSTPDKFPVSGDTPDKNLILWDVAGFADRSRLDLLDEVRRVTVRGASIQLFREDLTSDHRALYYRFSSTAVSRYAGLYTGSRVDVTSLNRDTPTNPKDATTWRRLFVPCRWTTSPPKPIVRFVLPLTQSTEDSSDLPPEDRPKVSGLLAVLDESWYSIGGISEHFEAAIHLVDNPLHGSGQGKQKYFELGPDPALRGEGSPGTNTATSSLMLTTIGPIGHTFDTDAEAPRFVATSMLISAPDDPSETQLASGDESFSWYLAHVAFRRTLVKDVTGSTVTALESEWTEGRWVQFLPEATSLLPREKTDDVFLLWNDDFTDEIRFEPRRNDSGTLVQWDLRPGGDPHGEGSNLRVRYYLVVTERIVDARGRPGHETYLATAEQVTPMAYSFRVRHPRDAAALKTTLRQSTQSVRLRILEVQYHVDHESNVSHGELWDLLFGAGDEVDISTRRDALARVVRISPPTDHRLRENAP